MLNVQLNVESEEENLQIGPRDSLITDVLPVMVWVTNEDGNCVYLNQRWYEYTGQIFKEGLDKDWLDPVHPEDIAQTKHVFEQASLKQEPFHLEYRLRNSNGEYRWMIDAGQPRFNREGGFIGYVGTVLDIHERKIAEEELQQSESDFRNLADSIPQIVWVTRPDGYHEYFNKYWYDYTGVDFNESKGEGWNHLFHPDDQKEAWERWRHSLTTGDKYEIEYRLRNGFTGEYKWFLGRAVPIRNKKNEVVKWFGTCTDIHDQKKASESQRFLAEAGRWLTTSTDYRKNLQKIASLAVPDIADWCAIDLVEEGELVQVALAHKDPSKVKWAQELRKKWPPDLDDNSGVSRVIKSGKCEFYPQITSEMIGKSLSDPERVELAKKIGLTSAILSPITIGQETVGVVQFIFSDSQEFFNEFDVQMSEKLASRIALSIQNATLFEQAQTLEQQFQAFYTSNIIGVFRTNLENEILDANQAFLHMIGFSKPVAEIQKTSLMKLFPPEHLPQIEKAHGELEATGSMTPWECEFIREDGSQIPVIIGGVLLDKDDGEVLNFVLDITERKKLEQRKDEFIGIASHELKTPLTSIKGYVQILEKIIQQMGDEKLEMYLKKTNSYVDRLNSLIVELLDVSKIQAGKLQLNLSSFDFDTLVKEVVDNAKYISTSHTIIIEGEANTEVKGDRHRLEQVFANLLSNAMKYSPDAERIVITITKNDREIIASVRDFGIGISQKEVPKLFQRFYRIESSAKAFSGLGIGLYISNEIITRHGGKMWVESEERVGSNFYFTLPLNQ